MAPHNLNPQTVDLFSMVHEAQVRFFASFHNLRQSRGNGTVPLEDLVEDIKSSAPRSYKLLQTHYQDNFGSAELKKLLNSYFQKGLFEEVEPNCIREVADNFVERVLMFEAGKVMPMDFTCDEDRKVFLVAILSHILVFAKPKPQEFISLDQIFADLAGETRERFKEGFGFELSLYILSQLLLEATRAGLLEKDKTGKYRLSSFEKVKKFLTLAFTEEKKRRKDEA